MYYQSRYVICLLFIILSIYVNAQETNRPFIWAKQGDKSEILNKIETQPWAKSFYKDFTSRLERDISLYNDSPHQFLSKIPFDWDNQVIDKTPPLKTFENFTYSNSEERYQLNRYLQIAIDCGVLFYLTEEDDYAQCALDILYSIVEGVSQIEPSKERGNGGWIYPNDHLREARVIGAQVPIVYDFIESYISTGKKAYDVGKKKLVDFPLEKAQRVFHTYARLAAEHGHTGSNWSVLESFSLVQNALALNDLELRKKYLDYYLIEGTSRQDALPDISSKYKKEGDVYPETSQYSNGVAGYTTRMLILLDNYEPNLHLGLDHYKIPYSLDRWNSIRYPNGEIIRFGDGKRNYDIPYHLYDMAYSLSVQCGVSKLTDKFGPLITEGISRGDYSRESVGSRSFSASPYFTPTKLFWLNETKDYSFEEMESPRTDNFPHAGVYLQRNLSSTGLKRNDLMCFVGGSHMVHGHASGMDMELYGLGEVLGVDHGRGKYRTDLHENYSRLFAAHNTVIVNGSSQGEGGWVSLGMNSVQLDVMEPMPEKEALSPDFSFTRTTFIDDKGDKAEATQERTMALIRTSPTTGYYMDVFRSKSVLPDEYHDYVYHNIGDGLQFINDEIELKSDADRYMANANAEHRYNKKFRNPGWHFFKDVQSSGSYENDVQVQFLIKKLRGKDRFMNVYIPGNLNREYTKVMAPNTFEAPEPYDALPTPTLVIRQKGEAWSNPFSVIYEPTYQKKSNTGIQSVSKLESQGLFKGFKVVSQVDGEELVQYIINQEKSGEYENSELGLYFKGAFAIITMDEYKTIKNVYVGSGYTLKANDILVSSVDNQTMGAYLEFVNGEIQVSNTQNAKVTR
ncbi:MAG: hypothetical protein HKN68_04480 [Saprospiraceae bacterium]|nr:hypothetical protein [Saprospiraceae bacterium]